MSTLVCHEQPLSTGLGEHYAPFKLKSSARLNKGRLAREWKTMSAMVYCYCRHKHNGNPLCPECEGLLQYATLRLERCRFGPEKPTCAKCPVHCYQRGRREQIRDVMRFAGPRMLWEHPLLSLRHWIDGLGSPGLRNPECLT
jgi:hypothetical protein